MPDLLQHLARPVVTVTPSWRHPRMWRADCAHCSWHVSPSGKTYLSQLATCHRRAHRTSRVARDGHQYAGAHPVYNRSANVSGDRAGCSCGWISQYVHSGDTRSTESLALRDWQEHAAADEASPEAPRVP